MGAKRVVGPGGRVWTVGRRWVGDPPRLRRRDRDLDFDTGGDGGDDGGWWTDLLDFSLDDITPGAILAALAFTVLMILVFTVVWPLVAIALEIVLFVVVAAAGLAGRFLLRRPWTVEARAQHLRAEWKISGWRASGALVQQVAERIAAGEDPRRIETPLRNQDQLHVG